MTDRRRHTVQTTYVSGRAVEQLPAFLSKLDSLYLRGLRRR
ncbi:hypothetical protein [Streptomyces adustus]